MIQIGGQASDSDTKDLRYPFGLPFGSNDAREIAISIAAQLLVERDRLEFHD